MASRRVHARRGRRAAVDAASAQVLLGWVSVRGCERAKENAEEGVREKRQELTDAQALQKEHEDALETSGDDQVKALEDAISRGNDEMKACRESTTEATRALAAQEKCVKAAQRLEKQQKDLLAGASAASRFRGSSDDAPRRSRRSEPWDYGFLVSGTCPSTTRKDCRCRTSCVSGSVVGRT